MRKDIEVLKQAFVDILMGIIDKTIKIMARETRYINFCFWESGNYVIRKYKEVSRANSLMIKGGLGQAGGSGGSLTCMLH